MRLRGGRYELTERIAVGGMGEVWAGVDNVLGRSIAVKILRDDLVDSPGFLDRFRAEARHTAALAHPGIAGVFDYGEERRDGRCVAYLVMELVEGSPLSKVIADRGTLSVSTSLSLLAQVAEALHAAHVQGVVHRDVKPGNILLLDDGSIKVTDFGVARAASSASITEVGQIVGTAQYMSPEQARGDDVTPSSDIYSLGVIGYELLVGRPPFTGDHPAALAMAHVQQSPPPLPPAVPAPVRSAIERALAKDPARRPSDARAFAGELRRLQAGPLATAVASAGGEADLPTRLMKAHRSRTAIMPVGAVHRPSTFGVAREIAAAQRRRRLLVAGLVVLAVLGGVAFAQRGVDDDLMRVTPTSQPATDSAPPSTTVAVSVSSVAPTPAAVSNDIDNNGNGNGKGKGKNKDKDKPDG